MERATNALSQLAGKEICMSIIRVDPHMLALILVHAGIGKTPGIIGNIITLTWT